MASRTMERNWEKRIVTILGKEYDYGKLNTKMKEMAGFLGFGTKLVDNLAGMKAYTSEEKLKKVDKVYENLLNGNWRIPGEGGTSAKAERAKVIEAYTNASAADRKVMEKCLVGQGYDFSGIK